MYNPIQLTDTLLALCKDRGESLLLSGENAFRYLYIERDLHFPIEYYVIARNADSFLDEFTKILAGISCQRNDDGSLYGYDNDELLFSLITVSSDNPSASVDDVCISQDVFEELQPSKINLESLFLIPQGGEYRVLDPFNVAEDLENKKLRMLNAPDQTDTDQTILKLMDYRIRYGYDLPDLLFEEAEDGAFIYHGRCKREFREVLFNALSKEKPSVYLIELLKLGLYSSYFPQLNLLVGVEQMKEYNHKDVFYHTCQVIDNIAPLTDNVWLRFAALVHDIAKPGTKKFIENAGWTFHGHEVAGARMLKIIFIQLGLSQENLKYVRLLVKFHLRPIALAKKGVTDSAVRRLMTEMGEYVEDLITLCRADITSKNLVKVKTYLKNYDLVIERIQEVREKDKLRAFRPPVDGEEIMKVCNLKPSRQVGIIKKEIEEAILTGKIENTYEASFALLLRLKEKYGL